MKNCVDVLSGNSELTKNKLVNNVKEESTGKSFEHILSSVINTENINSIESNSNNVKETTLNSFDTPAMREISEKIKQNINDRVDSAVERLAAFFGIGKDLMLAILKSLNINPEDLLDETKRQYIIKKLCEQFQLSRKKVDELCELFKKF